MAPFRMNDTHEESFAATPIAVQLFSFFALNILHPQLLSDVSRNTKTRKNVGNEEK